MIIEAIISTLDQTGSPNFAPMGLMWGDESVTVRPFRNTRTFHNLVSSGYGVANVTDDVLAYVRCGLYKEILPHFPAKAVPGVVFQGTCSWLEMAMVSDNGSAERAELDCQVLYRGRQKDFYGFCRARNAVIEATILATRVALCDRTTVSEKLTHFEEIVEKTGGEAEKHAFRLVQDYLKKRGIDDRG